MPDLSPWGGDPEGWGTSGGHMGEEPLDGSSEAPIPHWPGPLLPAPCRAAPEEEETVCPLAPAPPAHPLAPAPSPPAHTHGAAGATILRVDALAAVSLGCTKRQQPLAVTTAKRHQQPVQGRGRRLDGSDTLLSPRPIPGLTWRCLPAPHMARGHPLPSQLQPLQPELLRLDHREDAPAGGTGDIRLSQSPVASRTRSQTRCSAQRGGCSLQSGKCSES